MVDIKKIVITRKLYHLEVKKRFQQVKHFKVKKKSASEKMMQDLGNIFKSKPQEKKKAPLPMAVADAQSKQKSGSNKWVILAGALLIAILLIAGGLVYISSKIAAEAQQVVVVVPPNPEFHSTLLDSGMVSAGELRANQNIAYLRMRHTLKGIKNFTITLSTYEDKLPEEIFVLSGFRDQADGYGDFIDELTRNLSSRNVRIKSISIEELGTISNNSLVLIPSGRPPQQILNKNATSNIFVLADRGVVLVYMGQPFNRMLTDNDLVVSTPQNISKDLPIVFAESGAVESKEDFNLYQPLYTVSSASPIFSESFQIYGSVSVLKASSGGAILFLPQTLDGGWVDSSRNRDPRLAARDIARIIYETPWSKTIGQSRNYTQILANDSEILADYFTNTFEKSDFKSIKMNFIAYGENSTPEEFKIFQVARKVKGDLFIDGGYTVVPNEISLQSTRMNAILRGENADQKFLSLTIASKGKEIGDSFPIGRGPISVQSEFPIDIPLHLDSGEYIATIFDEDGKSYASTYLKIVFLDPVKIGQPKRAVYLFSLQRDGQPYKIRDIQVSVDKGKLGVYSFKDTDSISVDVSNFTDGENLPTGTHNFDFKVGSITKSVPWVIPVPQGGIFTDPFFIGTIFFALVIVGIGIYFSRKEEVMFQLDIPDFPPVTKTKIALNTDTVLSLFEKINQDYKWKYTPLTTYEIKNGFRNIFYKGQPIYITDYNVEFMLDQLVAKGNVKEELGYYGLYSWEAKSKKSIGYLSLFRKIRDICVNNATPFTSMGESENCDTTITSVGQDMFIHICDEKGDVAKMISDTLKSVKKGISIVLFEDESKKANFEQYLSSSSTGMLTLKLEVDSGSVLLLTVYELEKMLKELKAV